MPLAQRAAQAVAIAQTLDPAYADWDVPNPQTRRRRGRMARDLAAILGVDPACVIATADPDRSYAGYPGHLLTVIDQDTTYRFVPDAGFSEDGFCLLGPRPGCGNDVAVAEINQLADLGHYLEIGPPEQFGPHLVDLNHQPGCPHGSHD